MRKILLFGLTFVPLLLIFAGCYPRVLPLYERTLRFTANPLLQRLAPPVSIRDAGEAGWSVLTYSPGAGWTPAVSVPASTLRQVHAGIVLLPALLLATPLGWRGRAGVLALGIALLFVLQVLTHAAFFWAWARFDFPAPGNFGYNLLALVHGTAGQVYPVLLWGLLTWRFWLPAAAPPAESGAVGRNAPCPCGSGRKFKHCCEPEAR